MRRTRARLLTVAALVAAATGIFSTSSPSGLLAPRLAEAQNLGQRVVSGRVLDANSAVVSGATVFLKNTKTKDIRSYTSAPDGKFRFTGVNMAEDHELWAEKDGRKSPTKSVSTWDARTQFECELKLK